MTIYTNAVRRAALSSTKVYEIKERMIAELKAIVDYKEHTAMIDKFIEGIEDAYSDNIAGGLEVLEESFEIGDDNE